MYRLTVSEPNLKVFYNVCASKYASQYVFMYCMYSTVLDVIMHFYIGQLCRHIHIYAPEKHA